MATLQANSASKGKEKLVEQDFNPNDLNPVITYRHFLSQNLGVRDPLRVVALCDSDAFYAACEMVRLKTPPDTPLVVLQWDSLIAVNYPARKYGISRMDKVKEAKKRCPHLVVVHVATYKEGQKEPGYWDEVDTNTHKVSLDYYRSESVKIAAMFKECLPECEIEKASIDEAFFDFTRPVRKIMLERFPYLAKVPPDAIHGIDTVLPPPPPITRNDLGHVINSPTPSSNDDSKLSGVSLEARQDGDANGGPSSVLQVHPPEKPSNETKLEKEAEIYENEDSITTWHDVALSIAAELMQKARQEVLEKLGYSTSAGIARNKFLAKLTASYKKPNSQSILRNAVIPRYLRPIPFQKIRFLGGKLGKALAEEFEASTVGDLLTINLDEFQRKFGEDSIWVYEILRGIDRAEVKEKSAVNKSMLASKNLPHAITQSSEGYHWIRVLAAELALRLNNARQNNPNLWPKTLVLHARKYPEAGRSKQASFPFTRQVTVDVVASAGDKLWKELFGNSAKMNITHVALAFTGIDVAEAGQQSIESFFKSGKNNKHPREPDGAENSVVDDSHARGSESPGQDFPSMSYVCAKCGKRLTVFLDSDVEDSDPLEIVRREHDDFHFAQELARGLSHEPEPKERPPKKRRGRAEPKGLEKFFKRK
ncbi:hypothetical protein APHAL10511_007395 [Amanita phalloides]|nr:hypothetical protein APHAL10511_007395 [Amanita phalloides]